MRITEGRGVSVRISFDELSKELQTKVYRACKDKMAKTASESCHYELRMEVAEDATSNEFLTEMLLHELYNEDVKQVIFKILNNKAFEITDEMRKELITSDCAEVREYVAKDKKTPQEILNYMLNEEILNHGDPDVITAVVYNSNFEMNNSFRELLAQSPCWAVRVLVAEDIDTEEDLLREMLVNEINKEELEDGDVVTTIINNGNFTPNPDDAEIYAKSKDPEVRIMAIDSEKVTIELLFKILYNELENDEDDKVIEAVLFNKLFKDKLKELIER